MLMTKDVSLCCNYLYYFPELFSAVLCNIMAHTAETSVRSEGHVQLLFDTMRDLYQCQQLTDMTLVAEGQEFKVHMVVLAAYSTYFHSILGAPGQNYPMKHQLGNYL